MNHMRDMIILDVIYAVVGLSGVISGSIILAKVQHSIAHGTQAALPCPTFMCCMIAISFMMGALPFAYSLRETLRLIK